MVAVKKQNNTMDMVSNTKEVKVKEEERDNLVNDKVRRKEMEMKQNKEEGNKKKDKEKKRALKPKVAKYKKIKGKNRRDKEERGDECQREKDERRKEKEHNERVDEEKEKKDTEEEQKKMKGKERKEEWPREMEEKEQRERVDKEKAKKDKKEKQKKRKEKKLHEDRKRKGEQNEMNKEREEWQRETEKIEKMEILDKEKAKKDKEEKKQKRSEKEGQEKEVQSDREMREQMELEVEEDEQNERNGNEEPTQNAFPNFFKVVFPGYCTEQVGIPSSFSGFLENESPRVVSLRGPSGNTWRVELLADSKGRLHLAHGWKEFFNDHRIQLGYFLVFRYDGQSQFSVLVFDKSGCEAHDAFLARPRNAAVTNDGGGMSTNVDGMDPQEEHMEEDSCFLAEDDKEDMDTNAGDTNPQEEDTGGEEPECSEEEDDEWHMGSDDASDTSEKNDQDDNANYAPDTSEDDGVYHGLSTRKKRFRKIDDILSEDDRRASKKRKVVRKRSVASPHSSASKVATSGTIMTDTVNIVKSIAPARPRFQCTLFNKSNNVPRPGKVLTKVQRRPASISQRRPVTEEEKSDALERAMRFRSLRPFTHKALTYSEVYMTYFMVIPHEFVQKYFPKHSRKMTLWDPQAKPWEVSYVYWDSCSSSGAAFSAGWGAFAAYNNLEKSDVCVFEILDDDEYNIKVHIHRVVQEITPCMHTLIGGN